MFFLKDREKENQKASGASVWIQFMSELSLLATAEKTYNSLLYLTAKWFSKNDVSKME